MKLTNEKAVVAVPGSLEAAVLQYKFAAEQAKKFEAERAELADLIKSQVPVGQKQIIAGFEVSVSEYSERRFMPMAEAEKIVGSQMINLIAKAHTKQRLTVK